MADMLASIDDLRTLLEEDEADLPDAQATVLLEIATGEVQAAAGQDLLQVVDDEFDLTGTTDSWLDLPQRPVWEVSDVAIDGAAVTDYVRRGDRLWRRDGWAYSAYVPSTVTGTYTHGYPAGHQRLQLARGLVLAVAGTMVANATGASGLSIDDYREQYAQNARGAGDLLPERSQRLLRRTYGARSGLVKLG